MPSPEVKSRFPLDTLFYRVSFFNWSPPKISKYKIPCKLPEIVKRFVLRVLGGLQLKKVTLYIRLFHVLYQLSYCTVI